MAIGIIFEPEKVGGEHRKAGCFGLDDGQGVGYRLKGWPKVRGNGRHVFSFLTADNDQRWRVSQAEILAYSGKMLNWEGAG